MELAAAFKILIALALGAAIGLEREVHEQNDEHPQKTAIIGLRSFALITLLGTISGLLYKNYTGIFFIISISFMLLLLVHYIIDTWHTKDSGITTELATIFSYLIGVLIGINIFPIQLTIALTVVLILLLSYKDKIKDIIQDIQKREVIAFVGYALIALVILPFLPNKDFTLGDITNLKDFFSTIGIADTWLKIPLFNPFKTWLIVSLITGIDIAGYILERTIGANKGLFLSSMVGGFISSTATTQSLAQQSKESSVINRLVTAAILANLVSFFPPLFLIGSMNSEFLIKVLPTILIIMATTLLTGIFFLWKEKKGSNNLKDNYKTNNSSIFALGPALKFALIYLIIRAVSKIAIELFGQSGFLITSALGALTGIDAVVINTAELAGKAISFETAVLAFIIINAVNLLGKTVYSFIQGEKEFAWKFGSSMICIIMTSLIGLLFV